MIKGAGRDLAAQTLDQLIPRLAVAASGGADFIDDQEPLHLV